MVLGDNSCEIGQAQVLPGSAHVPFLRCFFMPSCHCLRAPLDEFQLHKLCLYLLPHQSYHYNNVFSNVRSVCFIRLVALPRTLFTFSIHKCLLMSRTGLVNSNNLKLFATDRLKKYSEYLKFRLLEFTLRCL